MAAVLISAFERIWDFLFEPGIENRFLIRNKLASPSISILYVFVCVFGRRLMKKRKPFSLKYIILTYNAMLVVFNAMSFYESTKIFRSISTNVICPENTVAAHQAVKEKLEVPMWGFFLLKFIECLETVFFILRKKDKQVTWLHMYHHAMVPLTVWVILYMPVVSFSSYMSWFINSAVHVIMYSYYFLAACGPAIRQFLWWKKYLTAIQIVQFVVILATVFSTFVSHCWPVTRAEIFLIVLVIPVFLLFLNFYWNEYLTKKKKKKAFAVK